MKKYFAFLMLAVMAGIVFLCAQVARSDYNTDHCMTKAEQACVLDQIQQLLALENSPVIRVYLMHTPGEFAYLITFYDMDRDKKADRVVVFGIGYFDEEGIAHVRVVQEMEPAEAEQVIKQHELQTGKGKV